MTGRYLLRFDRFEVDPHEGWLRRVGMLERDAPPGGRAGDTGTTGHGVVEGEIPLQPMVFRALVLFLERPGTLLTKEELLSHLWPDVEVEEGSLSQVIHKLRRALGDDADARRLIQTVPKRGFRFTAIVERVALPNAPLARLPVPAVFHDEDRGDESEAPDPAEGLPTSQPIIHDDAPRSAPRPQDVPLAPADLAPAVGARVAKQLELETSRADTDRAIGPRSFRRLAVGTVGIAALAIGVTFGLTARQGEPAPAPTFEGLDPLTGDGRSDAAPGPAPGSVEEFPLLSGGPHPIRRLTRFPERVQDAALAPDGTWFAFTSTRGSGGPYSIWAQRLDGGDAIRLTRPDGEDTRPRIFSDGRHVAFTRCSSTNPHALGCGVWQAAAFGGDEHLLVPDCYLGDVLSHVNALVCMRPGTPTGLDVLRVDVASRAETVLLHWDRPMDSIAVSPDGEGIAFLSGGTPWHFRPGFEAPVRVLEDGPEAITLAFAPDGRHLLCDLSLGGRRNIWAIPIDGGPRTALTAGAGTAVYPFAARDGRSLLFTQEHREYLMFRVPNDGGPPARIDSPTYWMSFSIDAAGRFMVYWDGDGADGNEVGVLDVMLGTMRGFGRGAVPAISADGRFLVRVLQGDLILTDIATLAERTLVQGGVRAVRPAFSPDGRYVAYAGSLPVRGLHRVDIDSGHIDTLAVGRFSAPSFSPDGKSIAAGGDRGGVDTSGTHIISSLGASSRDPVESFVVKGVRSYEAAPIWAPDGESLRILTNERSFAPRLVTAGRDGKVGDANGMPIPLTEEPANWGVFDVQVTQNGTMFYLLQRVHGDIYRVELAH